MEKMENKNKGITLIALVITIIVLLILAGISVATLTGENGILNKAEQSKNQTTITGEKEQIILAYNSVKSEKLVNQEHSTIRVNEYQKELDNQNANAIVWNEENETTLIITFIETKNKYFLYDTGNIDGPYKDEELGEDYAILEQLERKVATLENKTTMKTQTKTVSDIKLEYAIDKSIISITMEESGYADIFGYYQILNNSSDQYKGITIYKNDMRIAGNGRGGTGSKTQESVSCTIKVEKGDVIDLKAVQWINNEASITSATLQINYFPINEVESESNVHEKTITKRVGDLENKVVKLENKTNVKTLYNYETNKIIPTNTSTKVSTITIPEDCYADIYAFYDIINNDSDRYTGVELYLNGNFLTNQGKGGRGRLAFDSISLTKQLKKGDVIDLHVSQYIGNSKNLEKAILQIHYMPLTELEVTKKSDNRTLKERINELQTKITTLENKTTMKTVYGNIENLVVQNGVLVKLAEITIPEDCYADIYADYKITNNGSIEYKGIWLYKNGEWLCGNGKGGKGGETTMDENCMKELKKGDVITLCCDQYTGSTQTIKDAKFVINYFPK